MTKKCDREDEAWETEHKNERISVVFRYKLFRVDETYIQFRLGSQSDRFTELSFHWEMVSLNAYEMHCAGNSSPECIKLGGGTASLVIYSNLWNLEHFFICYSERVRLIQFGGTRRILTMWSHAGTLTMWPDTWAIILITNIHFEPEVRLWFEYFVTLHIYSEPRTVILATFHWLKLAP